MDIEMMEARIKPVTISADPEERWAVTVPGYWTLSRWPTEEEAREEADRLNADPASRAEVIRAAIRALTGEVTEDEIEWEDEADIEWDESDGEDLLWDEV